MKRFIPVLILLPILFVSCKKSEDKQKTKTELISQSSWKYDNGSIDTDNNGTGDLILPPGTIPACQIDNVLTFNSNGTGSADEGTTKCNVADPQTMPFTWTFTTNETVINFNAAIFVGVGGDFKILSLTETNLVLSKQLTLTGFPSPVTVIATFKH